jgi:hypothetical protein
MTVDDMICEMRLFSQQICRKTTGGESFSMQEFVDLSAALNAWADKLQVWERDAVLSWGKNIVKFTPRIVANSPQQNPLGQ